MPDLKPCPCCGGKAYSYSDGYGVWYGVQCHQCLLKTKEYRTIKESVEAWNRSAVEEDKHEAD